MFNDRTELELPKVSVKKHFFKDEFCLKLSNMGKKGLYLISFALHCSSRHYILQNFA